MSSIAYTCLMVGLDNAGKTTMIYNVKSNIFPMTVEIYPTAGFELHTVLLPTNKTALIYDCSGQGRYRDGWSIFFPEIDCLIYVIDSTDIERMSIVKENLEIILNNPIIAKKGLPIAILLNKQDDQLKALNKEILKEFLKLDQFKSQYKKMLIKETSGINGAGVNECFEWLNNSVLNK